MNLESKESASDNMATEPIIETRGLDKYFSRGGLVSNLLPGAELEPIKAVDNVSLSITAEESVGVIGESGCGKTTLLKCLIGLHSPTNGEILFRGKPTSEFTKNDWHNYRQSVQIIFQDPFNSLDPRFTVHRTLMEPLKVHGIDNREERIHDVLERVEMNPPSRYLSQRPDQLSGGEKQRISIARALILEPDVILADEPLSMLDVSTQAAILELLRDLIDDTGISMFYISHDLSTVSYICESMNVMYLGRVIESAQTEELISNPKHPYTQALIDAIPIPDPTAGRKRTEMSGAPRDPIGLGEGCRFRDRCPERMEICEKTPKFVRPDSEATEDHRVACHLYYDHNS